MIRAWFGDLGDGVHKGDEDDPRVSVIEVVPENVSARNAEYCVVRTLACVDESLGCRSRIGK